MGVNLEGKLFSVELMNLNPDNRPKRFYYRKCGMQVGPWPYDLKSQRYYLNKGFLLEPPEKKKEASLRKPEDSKFTCQICGKKHDKLSRLIACLKKHKKEDKDGIS